ncbi:ferro-O2-oxidoreductase [Mrakia frigida]|uniref:ferro-O2-oxidoreductase n=1 Tax=Mrakia frigida TaxID=29902 RepID=UPI003FCC139B
MLYTLPLFAALAALRPVESKLVEHHWNISYVTANPDQMFERRMIGVNGSWPPPPIEVVRGDHLRIHAYNGLGDVGTALHTHGNYFNHTSNPESGAYFDGAVGVVQCPIPPGSTFTYEIPTDLQEGTYWIHGHYNGQYVDGLRSPFNILSNNETKRTDISWDEEYTIVLADHYHQEHEPLLRWFLNRFNPTGAEPVPESPLLYVVKDSEYLVPPSELARGTGVGDRATITFEAGKTYRLRFVNMSALAMFQIWIDGHEMEIIEADGVEVAPYFVDDFPIAVAQRYSVLVKARNDTSSNWVLHAEMDPRMFDVVPEELVLGISATISYSEANERVEGITKDVEEAPFFQDLVLVPLEVVSQAPADVSIEMEFGFETFSNGHNRGAFNKITYVSPIVPSIFTQFSTGDNATKSSTYGAQSPTFVLNHGDMVELNIINTDDGQHPFHLHGHKFQVVHRSFDLSSDDPEINPPMVEGQANPFQRDTVMVPPGGSTAIRFRADNPGAWLFHCHVDWHLSSGLAAVFVTGTEKVQNEFEIPQFLIDQCAAQGIPTSGNAVGIMSATDLSGQPLGPWPIEAGFNSKAKAAIGGCIFTALAGVLAVFWYSSGALNDSEIEAEENRKQDQKQADLASGRKRGLRGLVSKVVGGAGSN